MWLEWYRASSSDRSPFHIYVWDPQGPGSLSSFPSSFIAFFCFLAWLVPILSVLKSRGRHYLLQEAFSGHLPSNLLSLFLFQDCSPTCSYPRDFRNYLHYGPSVLDWQTIFCSSHGPMNSLRAGTAFCHFCFPAGAVWIHPDQNLLNNLSTQDHKGLSHSCLEHWLLNCVCPILR